MNAHVAIKSDFWSTVDAELTAAADKAARTLLEADEAALKRGVRSLIERPWLADRVVTGASNLSLMQLTISAVRNQSNKMGVRQLKRALVDPEFCRAWNAYRERMPQL